MACLRIYEQTFILITITQLCSLYLSLSLSLSLSGIFLKTLSLSLSLSLIHTCRQFLLSIKPETIRPERNYSHKTRVLQSLCNLLQYKTAISFFLHPEKLCMSKFCDEILPNRKNKTNVIENNNNTTNNLIFKEIAIEIVN